MSNLIPPNDHWDELVPEAPKNAVPTQQDHAELFERPQNQAAPGMAMPKARRISPRLIVFGLFGVIALFGWISNRGTTVADDLQPGDCFMMPEGDAEFDRLDTEDCSAPHDAEIVRVTTMPRTGPMPAADSEYWDTVFNACLESGTNVKVDELPADYELGFFSPAEDGWDAGDRTSLCYVYAPSGLNGSMLLGR